MVAATDSLVEDEVALKVIVAKDSRSKAIFAHGVLAKGSDDGYPVECLVQDITWLLATTAFVCAATMSELS